MTALLAAAMSLAPAAMCAAQDTQTIQTQQSADNTRHSEWLPEFTGVRIRAAIEIRLVKVPDSEAPRIVYDTKGVTDSKFKAQVDKSGMLNITERIQRDSRSRTVVEVCYHTLESVDISGAEATFGQSIEQPMLNIVVSGGGKVTAETDVVDLEVELSGKNTRAKLAGKARYAEIAASGGVVDASALEAVSAEVTASLGAEVTVRATERIVTSASTSATVTYRGNPVIRKARAAVLGGTVKDVSEPEN